MASASWHEWIDLQQLAAWMDAQGGAIPTIQPRQHDDLVAGCEVTQAIRDPRVEHQPRRRRPFEALLRGLRAIHERRSDDADRVNGDHVPRLSPSGRLPGIRPSAAPPVMVVPRLTLAAPD